MGRKIMLHYAESNNQAVMVDWDRVREASSLPNGGTILQFENDYINADGEKPSWGYIGVSEDFETVCAMGERSGDDVVEATLEDRSRVVVEDLAKALSTAFSTGQKLGMDAVEVATSEHERLRKMGDPEAAALWLAVSISIRIVRAETLAEERADEG